MNSDKIIALHDAWKESEAKIPENEYTKGYKSREKTARKKWREFEAACLAEGYKPMEVAMFLMPKNWSM